MSHGVSEWSGQGAGKGRGVGRGEGRGHTDGRTDRRTGRGGALVSPLHLPSCLDRQPTLPTGQDLLGSPVVGSVGEGGWVGGRRGSIRVEERKRMREEGE